VEGDTAPTADQAKALWDEVNQEREAGDEPPSQPGDPKPGETVAETPPADADAAKETTTEATTTDPKPAETTAAAEPDPYEGLSPAVKARLQRLEALEAQVALIPQLDQSLKTAQGRVAAMQREMDAAKAAAKATPGGPTTAQLQAAAKSEEKWISLRADFPEWADATDERIQAAIAGVTSQQMQGMTTEQVAALVQEKVAAAEAKTTRMVEEAKIEGKYENWREVINTPQFVDWYKQQPPELHALGASESGRDAVKLLDKYHEATAKPADAVQEDRKAKLAAAASARPSATPSSTRKAEDQMTPKELWELERKRGEKRHAGLNY
jgi:hypothetical protein